MIRFVAKLALAYLAERLIVKPKPTSAESILRWRMTVMMMDARDAFRRVNEVMGKLSRDVLELAERMEES